MKVVFMGTPDFAVATVDAIAKAGHEIVMVVTQPDKPKGRGKEMQFPAVKTWAVEHDIPVYQPKRIREPEAVEVLKKQDADIFIVAAFGQILPKEVLEIPPLGCVNVHASLLPKYRGAAPIQWAVMNGDEVSGVTTMQMGVGLDDGDMLLKEEVRLAADETGGSLFDKLAIVGGELCVKTMEGLAAGTITPVSQEEAEATHVGMIKKSMGNLDFTRPAVELERLMRGLDPAPAAYSFLDGKLLKLFGADVVDSDKEYSAQECGIITNITKNTFDITTGAGVLRVNEVQLEGKKRMDAASFLRGCRLTEGTALKNSR